MNIYITASDIVERQRERDLENTRTRDREYQELCKSLEGLTDEQKTMKCLNDLGYGLR